jgi:hypothetical protein
MMSGHSAAEQCADDLAGVCAKATQNFVPARRDIGHQVNSVYAPHSTSSLYLFGYGRLSSNVLNGQKTDAFSG